MTQDYLCAVALACIVSGLVPDSPMHASLAGPVQTGSVYIQTHQFTAPRAECDRLVRMHAEIANMAGLGVIARCY